MLWIPAFAGMTFVKTGVHAMDSCLRRNDIRKDWGTCYGFLPSQE